MKLSGHTSYYINVGQTIGIVGALILCWRALKLEEAKAGIEHRSVREVISDDIRKAQDWYYKNVAYKQYRHN